MNHAVKGTLGVLAALVLSACAHGFGDVEVADNTPPNARHLGRFPASGSEKAPVVAQNTGAQCAR